MTLSCTRRLRRLASLIGVALSLAMWCGVMSTAPAAEATSATGTSASVEVFLQAPDPAALADLAAQPLTDRSARLRQLAALMPSAAQVNEVTSALAARGFTVTQESIWSVTASAPASVVSSVFGTRPTVGADPSAARLRAAAGPLPQMPEALSGLVSAVYPTTGGPAPFHHQVTGALLGADVRNAGASANTTPTTGQNDAGQTIATIQLSDWQSSDLTAYASSQGLADPVASGQYTAEIVGAGPANSNGSREVDLDQQSILSTAPTARQLAVFATNNHAGFRDAFQAVLADVTQASGAANPDPHITALSVSWGLCEADTGSANINSMEPILESLVAAGVTIFTSSGDDGAYDCGGAATGVDFPASSPAVVAVGGTHLSAATSAPNTGTNWTETAWSCDSAQACTSGGGSGGGASSAFGRPAWQSTYVDTGSYSSSVGRLVPDIAAAGDPSTGFRIYHQGSTVQLGGTSLAAPLSAASLVNLLGDNGRTTGLGDIHDGLYRAYAGTSCLAATDPAKAYRDVTVGANGSDASAATAVGYDTVTGLGGVLWPALAPYLLTGTGSTTCTAPPSTTSASGGTTTPPTTPPTTGTTPTGSVITIAAHLRVRVVGHGHRRHRALVAVWTTTATGGAPASVQVRLTRSGHTRYASSRVSGRASVRAVPGRYVLTVRSVDDQGQLTATRRHLSVPRPR